MSCLMCSAAGSAPPAGPSDRVVTTAVTLSVTKKHLDLWTTDATPFYPARAILRGREARGKKHAANGGRGAPPGGGSLQGPPARSAWQGEHSVWATNCEGTRAKEGDQDTKMRGEFVRSNGVEATMKLLSDFQPGAQGRAILPRHTSLIEARYRACLPRLQRARIGTKNCTRHGCA